MAPPKCNN